MRASSATTTGQIAIALGIVTIIGLIFITFFYSHPGSAGNPFGTLNDVCVALGGVLNAGLMWLHWSFEDPAKFERTEEAKLARFREVRDLIE